MAEDKIRHDEIIESDLFRNTEKSATDLIAVLDRLENTFVKTGQAASKAFGNPQTVAQLKAETQAIKDIEAAELGLTEVQKQRVIAKQALATIRVEEAKQLAALKVATDAELRQQREATKQAKQQQDAYQKLSARHRELVKEAKNLAVAYGIESKQAIAAANAANKLDAQLKKIDGSLGQHQRNVGNYGSALKGLGSQLLGAFGISFGAAAVVSGLKSSVHAFVEAEKNARALGFALKNVAGEGEAAFNALIEQSEKLQATGGVFSDDEIQQAQLQLVNYGLLSDEVTALMPKILDLAAATGQDLGSATDTVIKGINGQVKGLKMVGLGFEDTGSRAENYTIILDKLTKFEGAAADQAQTTEGKYLVLMNRFDDLKEDIGEFLINEGAQYLDYWDVLTGKLSAVEMQQKKIRNATSEGMSPLTDEAIAAAAAADTAGEKLKILNLALIDLYTLQRNYNTERVAALRRGDDALVAGSTAQIEGVQAQIDRLIQARNELNNEAAKFDDRTGDNKNKGDAAKTAGSEFDAAQAEFDNLMFQIKTANEAADLSEKDRIARNKRNLELYKSEREREYQAYLFKKALREKERQEQLKKTREDIDLLEKLSDATFNGLERRIDNEEKALTDKGDTIDEELQRQSDRQLAGLDNTYSEQQRLKAENDAKMAELEEKRQRAAEAQQLAELFIEFTKAYAKDGDVNAAQKALAQAVAVKAIADTIAGSFYEGTEDTGTTAKPLDNKGGRVAILHDNERVIPKRLNKHLSGISNDELVDKALLFDAIYKPQLAAVMSAEDAKTFKRTESDWVGSAVLNQLVSLEKTVKDKPEKHTEWSDTEKAMKTTLRQMGVTKVIVHKRF